MTESSPQQSKSTNTLATTRLKCPYCFLEFHTPKKLVECRTCGALYHKACAKELGNNRCAALGCEGTLRSLSRIRKKHFSLSAKDNKLRPLPATDVIEGDRYQLWYQHRAFRLMLWIVFLGGFSMVTAPTTLKIARKLASKASALVSSEAGIVTNSQPSLLDKLLSYLKVKPTEATFPVKIQALTSSTTTRKPEPYPNARILLNGKFVGSADQFGMFLAMFRGQVGKKIGIRVEGQGEGNYLVAFRRLTLQKPDYRPREIILKAFLPHPPQKPEPLGDHAPPYSPPKKDLLPYLPQDPTPPHRYQRPSLRPATVGLQLRTSPSQAVVYLNNRLVPQGKTPLIIRIPYGKQVQIKIQKRGYPPHTFLWRARRNQDKHIRLFRHAPNEDSF